MTVSLAQIPGLASTSPHEFVEGLIAAAMKGVKIYLTSAAYSRLKAYFDEVGIRVKEADVREDDNFIIIKLDKFRITVELHEGGTVETRTFSLSAFVKALKDYTEKRRGTKGASKVYELIVPEELREILSSNIEDGES